MIMTAAWCFASRAPANSAPAMAIEGPRRLGIMFLTQGKEKGSADVAPPPSSFKGEVRREMGVLWGGGNEALMRGVEAAYCSISSLSTTALLCRSSLAA